MRWKNLTKRNWAWIHFKLALGIVWAVLMMTFPPEGIQITLQQPLIVVWMAMTILGTAVSLTGYVMTQFGGKPGVLGVSVELVGLMFFSIGPLVYFITQLYLVFAGNFHDRVALAAFAYSMCSVLLYRFVVVIPRFRREAHDETKEP